MVFWLLYDLVCRVFGQRKHGDVIVGALVFALVCIASWLACHWFAGRAAFSLVGAMMATAMSASVFFWIIPGQKKVIASIQADAPVNPIHGQRGKQRSVHNTYFTLPVLFTMLSGHYSFTYSHPQNWLVLILMMFAGAAIRQFFVMRHGYRLGRNGNPLSYGQMICNPAFSKSSNPLSIASLMDLAPRLPPTTRTVFFVSSSEKNFNPSLLVIVVPAIAALTGFPVTMIFSSGKNFSMSVVPVKIFVAFLPSIMFDRPAKEFDS